MREITINGRPFELHAVQGTVAGSSKELETRVHGGGGGLTNAVRLSSTTVTHDQIYVVDSAGKEHALRLQNWYVACREGHELTAVWLIRRGKNSGPYVAIRNATIDETKYDDKALAKVHRPLWPLAALAAPILLKFSALSLLLVVAALVFRWYAGNRGRDALKASGVLLAPI
jgi:hypothetical protein